MTSYFCDSDDEYVDYDHDFGEDSDTERSHFNEGEFYDSDDTRSSDGESFRMPSRYRSDVDVYFDVGVILTDFQSWAESREHFRRRTKRPFRNHKAQIGFAVPPEVPFVVRFDPRKCILAITYSNILCIDIDEKDGISKEKAAEYINRKAASMNLKFRLYETDHGLHAYCTSRTFNSKKRQSWSLMRDMQCDENYILFSAVNGFSIRIAPKALKEDQVESRQPLSKQEFDLQFVKKPWIENPVVGTGSENRALVAMVDLTDKLSTFVTQMPDLYQRINSNIEVDDVLRAVSNEAVKLFEMAKARHPKEFSVWLQEPDTFNVPYINSVTEWVPCKDPNNIKAKHPVDGKPIVIFQRSGKWAYVHNNKYSRLFDTQAAARKAVKIDFGDLKPPNVQPKIKPVSMGNLQPVSAPSSQLTSMSYTGGTNNGDVGCWQPEEVSQWVTNIFVGTPYASEYASVFESKGIDGDMLLHDLDDDALTRDLDIQIGIHRKKILRKRQELLAQSQLA